MLAANAAVRASHGFVAALVPGLVACGGGASPQTSSDRSIESVSESSDKQPPTATTRSAAEESPSAVVSRQIVQDDADEFRAGWCDGPGQNAVKRLLLMDGIAQDYDTTRESDCRTAALLPTLSAEQRADWRDYLIGYSAALAGCPPLPVSVPGGVLAFGPANISVLGLPPPVLGRDDVALLIEHYLAGFSAALDLSESENSEVEAQLWKTAEGVWDAGASGVLSSCGEGGP